MPDMLGKAKTQAGEAKEGNAMIAILRQLLTVIGVCGCIAGVILPVWNGFMHWIER